MFQIATYPRLDLNSDLLVLFISETFVRRRQKSFSNFPQSIHPTLKQFFPLKDFKGELGESVLLYPKELQAIKRILILGIGDEKKIKDDDIRKLGKLISEKQERIAIKRVHLFLGNLDTCRSDIIRLLTEGIRFQKYRFEEFKSEPKKYRKTAARFIFLCTKKEYTPRFRKILLETQALLDSVDITRNLANLPSNHLTPAKLSAFVESHFKQYPHVSVDVLEPKKLATGKFNALLAVGKGSAETPRLIVIHYKPLKKRVKTLALVGKGVTFDSGGISIKPSANMEEMKYDMCGAAAVVGNMDYIAKTKPGFAVVGIIPAAENMPGGRAIKPGDVVEAFNGKTIEIINTDAEGRLILADALAYAEKTFKPDAMIDFATLTGACVVALGDKITGLFTASEKLSTILRESGDASGDRVWPLPISDLYKEELKSEVADMKNIGSRWGGAITAAKVLEYFTGGIPWAHVDMAGTSYDVKNIDYLGKGATGFGVRLIGRSLSQIEKIL